MYNSMPYAHFSDDVLIGALAGANSAFSDREKLKGILDSGLNLAHLLDRAEAERLAPLLHRALLSLEPHDTVISKERRDDFRRSYYDIAARNALLYQGLHEVLVSLNESGVEVILLKGIALIQTVYKNMALRPMEDIDILVRSEDMPLVAKKLNELGYATLAGYPEDFRKGGMTIDVHCALINITRIASRKRACDVPLDELWKRSIAIEIEGQKARILCPEHFLMDLCLHLTLHHGLQGLLWFIDIAVFIREYGDKIDWDVFIGQASAYKIQRYIYYALYCAQKRLGITLPGSVLERLKPAKLNFFEAKIINLISSGRQSGSDIRFFLTFYAMEDIGGKLLFLREIIFPSPHVLKARYGFSSALRIPQCYFMHFGSILSAIFNLSRQMLIIRYS